MNKLSSSLRFSSGKLCLLLALLPCAGILQAQTRSQVGSIFAYPNGQTWSDFGAYVGPPTSLDFFNMNSSALKIVHSRFHVFKESDDTSWNWFPYSALRVFESKEIAAGRPPIFVTAYYEGKTRPVVWNWSLGLQGQDSGRPTTPPSSWEYAVNVSDSRFVNFWVNNYVRPILLSQYASLQNVWVGLDECAFIPALYGVIDDNGNFVSGVTWDKPFPQTAAAYYQSISSFFHQVRQLAPTLNLIPNSGGIADESQFANVFGAAQGLIVEELNQSTSVPAGGMYTRNLLQSQLSDYAAEAARGYSMVFGSVMSPSNQSRIRTSYLMYQLVKGPNTFYAPAITNSSLTLPPAAYDTIAEGLGNPTGALQSQQLPGTPSYDPGLRTYWRYFQNGLVYLNWTGSTRTITLPAGRTYYSGGKPVNEITLPDLTAAYVTF